MSDEQSSQRPEFDLASFLKTLPNKPGIYRMFNADDAVIYVGKARNLKRRVSSYFQKTATDNKTMALVSHVHHVEITLTASDNEALLLESNLIKKLQPRYNVLLRDDKSYPYIYISSTHSFPKMVFYRGAKKAKGLYFGPYPSSRAVRETLHLLQKVFQIRTCDDNFFKNRTRPCLQYQIKRCTAPCVKYISEEEYAASVKHVTQFLQGKTQNVLKDLQNKMRSASEKKHYESAALMRDQISMLQQISTTQVVNSQADDTDIMAVAFEGGRFCVSVLTVRDGRILGHRSYFPKTPKGATESDVLEAFIAQYYLQSTSPHPIPKHLILSVLPEEMSWLQAALTELAKSKVTCLTRTRGLRAKWLSMAMSNAQHALAADLASKANMRQRYETLQEVLGLDFLPERMECFDISHTQGEATKASCVVFDGEGPRKRDYRRFNITGIQAGDDYAAMAQALTRRYKKLKAAKEKGDDRLPDILWVDGGKGQLSTAEKILEDLQIEGVLLIAIAKGEGRKPGLETLFISGQPNAIHLASDSVALHLIQHIRDEAHRFAIAGHRAARAKTRSVSPLEGIDGVGPVKRRALLHHFGGLQEIKRASVADLQRVEGINKELAERIFATLHGDLPAK